MSEEMKNLAEELVNLTANEMWELVLELKTIQSQPVFRIWLDMFDQCVKMEMESFEVKLQYYGDSKINVIREVRSIMGIGLKDAKDLVELVPANMYDQSTGSQPVIASHLTFNRAWEIKNKFDYNTSAAVKVDKMKK